MWEAAHPAKADAALVKETKILIFKRKHRYLSVLFMYVYINYECT